MKKILVCFDGTGNEPEDAESDVNDAGESKGENISNVLKLHLRAGGRVNSPLEEFGQLSLIRRPTFCHRLQAAPRNSSLS